MGPPSAAIVVGTGPEPWVPPFFVDVPEPGMEDGGVRKLAGTKLRDEGEAQALYHTGHHA
eukprot:1426314-Prymnesium_polylepis.1